MKIKRKIMIVAGEASGDGHAAKLANAIRDAAPDTDFEFFGAAGPKMRDAGVEAVVQSDALAIVGLAEIGRALPMFLRAKRDLKRAAADKKPVIVILVDFPDFNLKLAKALKKQGLMVVYYISPQLWAWRKYRVSTVRKYVDLLLTILPFEKDWYAGHGVAHVEYVGNPLAREVHAERTREEFRRDHGLDPTRPLIAMLPGSRHKEIVRIAPVMFETAKRLVESRSDIQFVVAAATPTGRKDIERAFAGHDLDLVIVENETYDALHASDAAAVTSGTATLEAGILSTPMVIVYKTSAINYSLLEPLISVEHYGLINLIAGERLATELIQRDFTPATVAAELLRLMQPDENAAVREKLRLTTEKLGHGGASKRAAEAVLRMMGE